MGLRNNVPGCLTCKYTNTNTQIHKYANTALVKVANRHYICYIFEKVMVRGLQKQYSWLSDFQIHKYKYAYTVLVKVADRHDMCYIFEKVMVRGPQKQCSLVSDLQIHKYKYTNMQIQHWSKLQKDMTCAIFSRRYWYEDLKVPECMEYKYM